MSMNKSNMKPNNHNMKNYYLMLLTELRKMAQAIHSIKR